MTSAPDHRAEIPDTAPDEPRFDVARAVDALREHDWTGFDPSNLDDLVSVAGAVLNESDASFADVLRPSND